MDSIVETHIYELKGYVDACIDANSEGEGVSFSMIETIQKKIEVIVLGMRDPVEP